MSSIYEKLVRFLKIAKAVLNPVYVLNRDGFKRRINPFKNSFKNALSTGFYAFRNAFPNAV